MLIADAARIPLVALLGLLAARPSVSVISLGPVAALIGAAAGLFIPASYAIMPSLLPGEKLNAGNALFSAVTQAASVLGPMIAAAIVAAAGTAPAFYMDSGSFAISVLTLAFIPRHHAGAPVDDCPAGPDGDGVPGVRPTGDPGRSWLALLRQERAFQFIILVILTGNIALFGTLEVALPALSHARFVATGYGTLITCLGAGTIIGTLASARHRATGHRPAVVSCIAFIVASLGIAGVPLLGGLPGAGAAIAIFGAATGFGNVIFITMLQKWAPPALLGRVISIVTLASAGCYPISVFITGVLVHGIGITPFFIIAGTLIALPMSIAITQRRFRDFGTDGTPQQGFTAVQQEKV